MWQATPSPSAVTFSSTVSSSQSTRIRRTASLLPDVSPFVQSWPRLRLKKVAKPLSRVFWSASCVHEADHQHLAGAVVLDDRRNQAVEFREIHVMRHKKKKAPLFPAGPWRVRVPESPSAHAQSDQPARAGAVVVRMMVPRG